MMNRDRLQRDAGFTTTSFLVVLLVLLVAVSGYLVFQNWQKERACESQLIAMYDVISRYEVRQGVLPELKFYPVNAFAEKGSLRLFLQQEGGRGELAVCPAIPRFLRKTGQTYLWNDALNGRHLSAFSEPQWMLVEMNALSPDVPPPHWGRYHVLMTDGTIQKLSLPQIQAMNIPLAHE